jgi:hypothetical protein
MKRVVAPVVRFARDSRGFGGRLGVLKNQTRFMFTVEHC